MIGYDYLVSPKSRQCFFHLVFSFDEGNKQTVVRNYYLNGLRNDMKAVRVCSLQHLEK